MRRKNLVIGAITGLVLVQAGISHAQLSRGNMDKDGTVVPSFAAPAGSAAIENSGEAKVVIPLSVPPGRRGMAPKLALRYSSAASDTGLGVGWALDLGYADAIRRSTRWGVPRYELQGTFTFNGQDVVRVGRSSRYRTRIDSFQRISRVGDGWVVVEKNGTQLEYGSSIDERSYIRRAGFQAPQTYAWHLSRVRDTFGNVIEFRYAGDPEQQEARRLSVILYTLSGAAVVGPEQRVTLVWGNRPAPLHSAIYGALIADRLRLEAIQTSSAGALVRSFELCYAEESCSEIEPTSRGNAVLAAVAERGGSDSLALGKFSYQARDAGWTEKGPTTPLPFVEHYTGEDERAGDTGVRFG